LGFKNRRSVDIFRLFKVQNMGKISCQNSESIFSSFHSEPLADGLNEGNLTYLNGELIVLALLSNHS
jgi:hypothetical protein